MTASIADLWALYFGGGADAAYAALKAYADAGIDVLDVLAVASGTDTAEIVDGAVTTAKLHDDAVTSAKIADGTIVNADINASAAIAESKLSLASDAAAGTASRRTLGTSATSACAGNDSRLSDTRTPTDNSVTSAKIVDGAIVNADINASAAIDTSKLADSSLVTGAAQKSSNLSDLTAPLTARTTNLGVAIPGPTGSIAETFPRNSNINNAVTLSQGYLQLHGIWLPAGVTISSITFWGGAQAAVNPTHWWYGLYSPSRVQLAVTADQTSTAFAANVAHTLNIATIASGASATYTTTVTGWHYLGVMMTSSTTQASLAALSTANTTAQNNISLAAPCVWGNDTSGTGAGSLTTPPAFAYTAGAPNGAVNYAYAYVS